ncbi:MAG: acyl-CoA thioesterase [Leptospiraceae bacterium]|nr:acyl-CoA thioesterase [Leptospiraceae bacterium]MCP5510487.1 acyl-CoA thioesterase [Leptospiraceae bacterium]
MDRIEKDPNEYRFHKEIKISWGDMDAFGHVNNVEYVRYFERIRAEYFSYLQLWENDGKHPKSGMVIVNINMDYRKQATYPQKLNSYLKTSSLNRKIFKMDLLILDESSDVVVTARGTFLWYDFVNSKTIPLPEAFLLKVKEYEGLLID